jgi:hypothetical protein
VFNFTLRLLFSEGKKPGYSLYDDDDDDDDDVNKDWCCTPIKT